MGQRLPLPPEDDSPRQHWLLALLGLPATQHLALVRKIRDGLSFRHLERLGEVLDLPWAIVCPLVGLSPRTLERRRRGGRLSPAESDRLLTTARLIGLAERLFEGDRQRTRTWLLAPQAAFAGATPLDLASTEVGAREVEALIGRLEHGVLA